MATANAMSSLCFRLIAPSVNTCFPRSWKPGKTRIRIRRIRAFSRFFFYIRSDLLFMSVLLIHAREKKDPPCIFFLRPGKVACRFYVHQKGGDPVGILHWTGEVIAA